MKANAYITPKIGELKYKYSPLINLKTDDSGYLFMRSKKFNFDLNHPVEMEPSFSYDGSTDLIFIDNKNIPRLINSRFKLLENGQYKIPLRLGIKPENVYDDKHFEQAIQLQRISSTIPKIKLSNIIHPGNLKVGNYTFYIKYIDGDYNESDFVAESGIISCFIGSNKRPKTINGGYRNQNSNKSIILEMSNLDTSYESIVIYYSRETSDEDGNKDPLYFKIDKPYTYNGSTSRFRITGDEITTSITLEQLLRRYIIIDSAKTMALCQNMLFFGNIKSPSDNGKELIDISLRFLPYLHIENTIDTIGSVNTKDYSVIGEAGYYNVNNIYNKVGYWNEEFYRFGVVYIYNDGRLSSVYNIRGIKELSINTDNYLLFPFYVSESNSIRNYIPYDNTNYTINESDIENNKGVFRINCGNSTPNIIRSIGIAFDDNALQYLKKLGIKGFFFVRQKRIPTILAQAVSLNMSGGSNPKVNVPVLPINGESYVERFIDDNGTLTHDYEKHLLLLNSTANGCYAALCPEYNLNLPYYNLLLVGDKLQTKLIGKSNFNRDGRHFYLSDITSNNSDYIYRKVLSIPDETSTMGIDKTSYKGIAGEKELAFKVGYIGSKPIIKFKKWDPLKKTRKFSKSQTKYIRGIYGPYLGIKGQTLYPGDIINIYIPGYDIKEINDYIKLRCLDTTSFYAISDRYEISELTLNSKNELQFNHNNLYLYRGDCFFATYTHRLNRNFLDSSTPLNSTIVDNETWRKYFNTDPAQIGELSNINRSDVNAVQLGSWFTFKVCCSENLNLRAIDKTDVRTKSLTGHYRSFYPISAINANSDYAIPESFILNRGFGTTLGAQNRSYSNEQQYYDNNYCNRIVYSNTKIKFLDSFTNAYRTFTDGQFDDYDLEKGSITKLVENNSVLYCIFEHGIAIIPILEKQPITSDDNIVIQSSSILPDKLTFIDSNFGSLWKDSIIKVESGRIYGVDTVAKKIWMIEGKSVKIISDLAIGLFLNNNLLLKEHELIVEIGKTNIKSHYNNFKGDVMFTFYKDDIVWNICYNDILLEFITFYSWIPLESQNVNNVFYSFTQQDLSNNKIYKHGFGGIIDNLEKINPTYWYDEQHPFEFEIIVNDTPQAHKIFNNLRLLSNKAEPESFHYEIIGECFDFAPDKLNAYYRLEAKKEMWKLNGSIMTYDKSYPSLKNQLRYNKKSVDFPLYYTLKERNSFWTNYAILLEESKDYCNLSGTELVHYPKLNEVRLLNHAPAIDIKKFSRLRGNMLYLEDFWNIQINPIVLVEKNEELWEVPPITIFNAPLPTDLPIKQITKLPDNNNYPVDMYRWGSRKEIKLKDKWMKVRIRYSGKDLALISALYTMYSISYA